MKYNDLTLEKIRDISILEVANRLGLNLKGAGTENKRCLCPYHDDKHPSMHLSKKKGIFKCFVCGAKGDSLQLVQDQKNLSFVESCEWMIKEFDIVVVPDAPASKSMRSVESLVEKKTSAFSPLPSDIVQRSLSVDSAFCKAVVSTGYLSEGQLRHAAACYRLGVSKDGGVIFWEIDDQQRVHTGKIMYYQSDCHRDKQHTPTWVHSLMKDKLPENYELQHCLFGLHLLTSALLLQPSAISLQPSALRLQPSDLSHQPSAIAIVESEKTAIILSELFPDFIWLSCGGLQMFKPELLAPLVNHKVVVFPDTDETGEAYNAWLTVLQQAQRQYPFKYPLRISNLLELHATPEQKQRKIDIVDYLFENSV